MKLSGAITEQIKELYIISLNTVSGTIYHFRLNKEFCSKFLVGHPDHLMKTGGHNDQNCIRQKLSHWIQNAILYNLLSTKIPDKYTLIIFTKIILSILRNLKHFLNRCSYWTNLASQIRLKIKIDKLLTNLLQIGDSVKNKLFQLNSVIKFRSNIFIFEHRNISRIKWDSAKSHNIFIILISQYKTKYNKTIPII